ncbi:MULTISPECIES: hypothetical protein, partial [Pseudomonas]|uniref:hypothetical protein n=1 Tax=Pseudomonas TaxID=286 RepID=UPI002B4144B4
LQEKVKALKKEGKVEIAVVIGFVVGQSNETAMQEIAFALSQKSQFKQGLGRCCWVWRRVVVGERRSIQSARVVERQGLRGEQLTAGWLLVQKVELLVPALKMRSCIQS